jgi:Lipocalin-like domain
MTEVWNEYKHRLIGGWRAISIELRASDSPDAHIIAKPHGDSPLGRAMISPNGFLSAHLVPPDRMKPLPSGQPWQTSPDAEVAHVARAFSGYCGYLKLYRDEASGEIWWETRVEVCLDPGRFGGLERRRLRFLEGEGGREIMELRPFQDMITEVSGPPVLWVLLIRGVQKGEKTRGIVRWEKFE